MTLFFSALSFLAPFILIPILPKTLPETAYLIAAYVILIPSAFLTSYFLSKSKLSINNYKLLIIFMVFYSLYLFLMSIARYYNFRSEIIDLSYYDHVVYQLSQFKIPHVWDNDWFVWGDHFDGILFLFVPLYWIKREPAILMALQSGLAILATIPIYLYAKEKFACPERSRGENLKFNNCKLFENCRAAARSRALSREKLKIENLHEGPQSNLLALSLSFSYLLFGAHQMGYLYGFHEIVMFPFFFFWMLYFMEKKSWKLFFLFLFLTTIIKEDTFMYLIFLGFYYLWKLRNCKFIENCRAAARSRASSREKLKIENFKIPLLFIFTGLLWYLFTFHLIFPSFYPYWDIHRGLYENLSSTAGILDLIRPYKIGTIINHLGPFGFLPLLYPPSLIVTIPAWAQKLLTNDIASLSGFHYSSAITALIVFSSIESLTKYLKIKFGAGDVFFRPPKFANFGGSTAKKISPNEIIIFIILLAFYSNYFLGYSASSLSKISLREFLPTPFQQTAYDFMKEIPKDASVSASYILVPHLKKPTGLIHAVPRINEDSEYILLNHNISIPLTTTSLYKQYLGSLENNYQILKSQNNVFLLKSSIDKPIKLSP